ncbi:hypothetical protein [Adonisia turfae]|nr:hypothetical protein [Adonisia turfae]
MIGALTLTAAQAIAEIALDKFVEGGSGELGKNLTTALTQKVMQLGTVVWNKIHGIRPAVAALEGATQDKPEEAQKLKKYLFKLWEDDQSEFAQAVKKLADELHFELTQIEDNSSMTQINRENARGWQIKVTGGTDTQIGEIHNHG